MELETDQNSRHSREDIQNASRHSREDMQDVSLRNSSDDGCLRNEVKNDNSHDVYATGSTRSESDNRQPKNNEQVAPINHHLSGYVQNAASSSGFPNEPTSSLSEERFPIAYAPTNIQNLWRKSGNTAGITMLQQDLREEKKEKERLQKLVEEKDWQVKFFASRAEELHSECVSKDLTAYAVRGLRRCEVPDHQMEPTSRIQANSGKRCDLPARQSDQLAGVRTEVESLRRALCESENQQSSLKADLFRFRACAEGQAGKIAKLSEDRELLRNVFNNRPNGNDPTLTPQWGRSGGSSFEPCVIYRTRPAHGGIGSDSRRQYNFHSSAAGSAESEPAQITYGHPVIQPFKNVEEGLRRALPPTSRPVSQNMMELEFASLKSHVESQERERAVMLEDAVCVRERLATRTTELEASESEKERLVIDLHRCKKMLEFSNAQSKVQVDPPHAGMHLNRYGNCKADVDKLEKDSTSYMKTLTALDANGNVLRTQAVAAVAAEKTARNVVATYRIEQLEFVLGRQGRELDAALRENSRIIRDRSVESAKIDEATRALRTELGKAVEKHESALQSHEAAISEKTYEVQELKSVIRQLEAELNKKSVVHRLRPRPAMVEDTVGRGVGRASAAPMKSVKSANAVGRGVGRASVASMKSVKSANAVGRGVGRASAAPMKSVKSASFADCVGKDGLSRA